MSKCPITQKQYRLVMGTNPSSFQGDENRPVVKVSWNDAVRFCKRLSNKIDQKVKLPSEAQWEYALYTTNSGDKTHPVGEKLANSSRLLLYGMVYEWCEDVWHENYNGAPTDGSAWLTDGEQNKRALRHVSYRTFDVADCWKEDYGFRIVI